MKSISTDSNYGQAGSNNHFKRLLRCMLSREGDDGEDDARNSSAVARGRVEEEGNRGEREEARRKKKRRGIRREKETKKAPSHIVPVVLRRNTVKHSL